MAHRANEDGGLPRALTEDVSKARPHTQAEEEQVRLLQESKGQHFTGKHKPSLMDKLNPSKCQLRLYKTIAANSVNRG